MSEETKKTPDLIAYTTTEGPQKSYFHKVGVAWANRKEGYNIRLFSLPVNGEIVLLPPRPDDQSEDQDEDAA